MADEKAPWEENVAPWDSRESPFLDLSNTLGGKRTGTNPKEFAEAIKRLLINPTATALATGADEVLLGNLPNLTPLSREKLTEMQEESPVGSGIGTVGGLAASMYLTPQAKVMQAINALKATKGIKALAKIGTLAAEGGARGALAEPGPEGDRLTNAAVGAALSGGVGAIGEGTKAALGSGRRADRWRFKATGPTPTQQADVDWKAEDVGRTLREAGITDSRYKAPLMSMIPPDKQEMFTRIMGKPKRDKLGNIVYAPKTNTMVLQGGKLDEQMKNVRKHLSVMDEKSDWTIDRNRLETNILKKMDIKPGVPGSVQKMVDVKKMTDEVLEQLPQRPSDLYDIKSAVQGQGFGDDSAGQLGKEFSRAYSRALNEELDDLAQRTGGKDFRRAFQMDRRKAEHLLTSGEALDKSRFGAVEQITGYGNAGLPATAIGASFMASNPALLGFVPPLMAIKDVTRKPFLYGANFLDSDPALWPVMFNQAMRARGDRLMTPVEPLDKEPWEE
jgi:hypothetical protein